MREMRRLPERWLVGFLPLLLTCSVPAVFPGREQVPPTTGHEEVEIWLSQGFYRRWHCQAAPHPSRPPSDHGINRICSNDLASAAGPGEYPVDAASVKEFYDEQGKIVGYSVERHTRPGQTAETWYWYERVALDSTVPHDERGVAADGWGGSGPAHEICAGCHMGAGVGPHPGHDFVYTQVR